MRSHQKPARQAPGAPALQASASEAAAPLARSGTASGGGTNTVPASCQATAQKPASSSPALAASASTSVPLVAAQESQRRRQQCLHSGRAGVGEEPVLLLRVQLAQPQHGGKSLAGERALRSSSLSRGANDGTHLR